MPEVLAVGECLVDFIATMRGVKLDEAPAFEPRPGGAPANVAVGVARLGRSAGIAGRVGRDAFGRLLRERLAREYVTIDGLLDDPALPTTIAFVALSDGGDPDFVFYSGAHTRHEPADLASGLFESVRIVHGGSVALANEPSRAATMAAWRIAHSRNALCSYDVNWRPALWRDFEQGVAIARQPLAFIDICKMNAAESRLLTGESDPEKGLLALPERIALAVVTLGAAGCLARWHKTLFAASAPAVTDVLDATGAGDAFMAALLTGLPPSLTDLTHPALDSLLRRACRAGSIAVTRRGAMSALPTAADLDD